MAIDLYSKASVDALLADKLDDAPSDGTTYGRKDGAWVSTISSLDALATANAIASNIAYLTVGTGYGRWVGNQAPSIATTATWGLVDSSSNTATYSYSSGNNFYYTGTLTGSVFRVIVSSQPSSFTVS